MARLHRIDDPGNFYHLMNRGIARRSVFESASDRRFFLSRLAWCVRRGWIEVHAFCILSTHFHLVVRSTSERMSTSMRLVQSSYVRRFNRKYGRDGPLFRGRFLSRRIDSETYWWRVLRYVDLNARTAALVADPRHYPFGSAFHYARAAGPVWLTRAEVERSLCSAAGIARYVPSMYAPWLFDGGTTEAEYDLETRFDGSRARAQRRRPDFAVEGASSLAQNARLADDTVPLSVSVSPLQVERDIAGRVPGESTSCGGRGRRRDRNLVMTAGLLSDLCGLSVDSIAARLQRSRATISRAMCDHRRLASTDPAYRDMLPDGARRSFMFPRPQRPAET